MKDLPPDPPVYVPSSERWFERHEHDPKDNPVTGRARTLSAMWLTLHDRMRLPLPKKSRQLGVVEIEMLKSYVERVGADMAMTLWRSACNHVKRDENPETAFMNLLKAKGVKDE